VTKVHPDLTHKYGTGRERLVRDKHSSLIRLFGGDKEKKFDGKTFLRRRLLRAPAQMK